VRGDGHCQFRSLAYQLDGTDAGHTQATTKSRTRCALAVRNATSVHVLTRARSPPPPPL